MNLIYLDESGNTGVNLQDPDQPVFTLCALLVPEAKWQPIDSEIQKVIETQTPFDFQGDFEIHATELRNGTGAWKGIPHKQRLDCRDALLDVLVRHELCIFAKSTEKKRYASWCHRAFGSDIVVNPHIPAHVLLSQNLNQHLKNLGKEELGILIHDENKDVDMEIETFIRMLQADSGVLRLERILEKGFFISSKQSRLLQMADLCAFYVRKDQEQKAGKSITGADQLALEAIHKLMRSSETDLGEALQWLKTHIKKRSGEGPHGTESPRGGRSRR